MKKILFHVAVIVTAIIAIAMIGLRQSTINFEDLPTYPHDYVPRLEGVNEYYAEVIAVKDIIVVEYKLGHFPIPEEAIPILAIEENKPLPLSPVSASYLLPKAITIEERIEGRVELTLALAIISKGDTPAVYRLRVNGIAIAYFSDPFPTGNNNLVLYTKIDIIKGEEVKVEIERVKVL
ncbi:MULTISPECIES: hypothetical protein [Candidatus Nitrosocaldus]|jgi:hypothetical protein|uniref:Uncharacterized protein n=1 Tax=Candidatus Nitrosocaldus cavascurensis TaxID=2058097 RepID=A0A2K5ARE0_9ARCH|nr:MULTISPECIES: hypothetical protein [Candidatus Nitrosocaldus]SPC34221.1 protein of unknown function [Candidatus Nitrosocaldus cavascurensis]